MQLLFQENPVFRTHSKHHRDSTTTIKNTGHTAYASTHYIQTSSSISWISWLLQKIYKGFCQNSKTINIDYMPKVKFDWTPLHHTAFLSLKEAIIQAPILHYPDPNKKYIIYTDASDDACGAQLLQEHNGMEFPIAFFSHTFTETQRKWSTTKQEAYGVYYAITKWNYYLQGMDIIVKNDHKPLTKFLNGKNANNNVNRWSLELATYNITSKWISGAKNKVADCLSWLVEQLPTTPATVNMLTVTHTDGPASNIRSHMKKDSPGTTFTPNGDVTPNISPDKNQTSKSLTADRLEAFLQKGEDAYILQTYF